MDDNIFRPKIIHFIEMNEHIIVLLDKKFKSNFNGHSDESK